MRMNGPLALAFLVAVATVAGAQAQFDAEAVRLNNRGAAQMSQQLTERAAGSFAQAFQKDPKLAQAAINEGIALLYLQKLDEAKKALRAALDLQTDSAQAWYNLGLVQHAGNELEPALDSFQHAVKIDPRDADSYYYEGVCYQELKQYDKAIAVLQEALKINRLHASAEFATARALQHMGRTAEAKEHFKLFQHMTSTKVSSPIGLAYGEQGHYSTVVPISAPGTAKRTMIPVKLVASSLAFKVPKAGPSSFTTTGGACSLDVTGSGSMDLVLMQTGAQAIRVLHNKGDGSFEDVDAVAAGLKAKGRAVACAVGDFDGDGLNDLAVALDDAVLLFRNLGKGKFEDVTAAVGLTPRNRPSGITFVDYDHDGDLDLLLTGSGLNHPNDKDPSLGTPEKADDAPNVLWRNNGNKTFTEWTEPVGFGGSGKTAAAILTDFNNDRAVDIAITGDGPAPLLYVNPREG